jgi:Caenorhabditis protein of unknown function, DUF268
MREDQPLVDYCDSVCLHALEHFGLWRYGDPVDPHGHLKGFRNLRRILQAGGTCYLSVPMGPQRTEFDSQRVFSLDYLLRMVSDGFHVERFSYVDDAGPLHEDLALSRSWWPQTAAARSAAPSSSWSGCAELSPVPG